MELLVLYLGDEFMRSFHYHVHYVGHISLGGDLIDGLVKSVYVWMALFST